ncbi:MAG: EFR1 family ferrodoxin [archaeon]|jgi:ferredoxin|nr:EFR1 family ferrodoxin [archaeon]MCK9439794.1 EFR1 family ferrodoxin [Patescibacteria group bacterium]MDD2477973.1 EFR1 family ferrodoxin [Candidatus ainarchaeum sp.]
MVDFLFKKENLKKGVFFYFSGTGNTEYVSRKYKELFKKKNISVDLKIISDIFITPSLSDYDFVIVGCPVYSFNPPLFVLEFLKILPVVEKKPFFVFATCEKTVGATFFSIKNILTSKNYDYRGSYKYLMPSNCNGLFGKEEISEDKIKEIISKTDLKIEKDFKNIIDDNKEEVKNFIFLIWGYLIIYKFFNKFYIKKHKWNFDSKKCIQCGLCERICPTNNIILKKKKNQLKFSNNCVLCTRCYNFCPTGAIYYKSSKNKSSKRYDFFKNNFKK